MTFFPEARTIGGSLARTRARGIAVATWSLGLLCATLAHADVAVMPPNGTNTTPSEDEVIGVLLADAYASVSAQPVVEPAIAKEALTTTGEAGAAAASLSADEFISVRIVKLDVHYSIRASRYAASGELIHSARITAGSLDDAAPAADRLARALFNKTSTREELSIDNVTVKESKTPNRVRTETIAGVKTGVTYPFAKGGSFVPMVTVNYDGRHEASDYFVEWGAGLIFPTGSDDDSKRSYGGLHLELGGSYYLTHSLVSPYVGAGILPRFLVSNVSLAPYAQAGVMFFRHSSTRVYTDVRFAQHVLPQSFEPLLSFGEEEEQEKVYPTEITVSFGVGF